MECQEFVVDQLYPTIIQGIAATLIIVRVGLCISNIQPGSFRSGPSPSVVPRTSSKQVHLDAISFMGPGHRLPAEMPVSENKSKLSSEDLSSGSGSSSMESIATVMV